MKFSRKMTESKSEGYLLLINQADFMKDDSSEMDNCDEDFNEVNSDVDDKENHSGNDQHWTESTVKFSILFLAQLDPSAIYY